MAAEFFRQYPSAAAAFAPATTREFQNGYVMALITELIRGGESGRNQVREQLDGIRTGLNDHRDVLMDFNPSTVPHVTEGIIFFKSQIKKLDTKFFTALLRNLSETIDSLDPDKVRFVHTLVAKPWEHATIQRNIFDLLFPAHAVKTVSIAAELTAAAAATTRDPVSAQHVKFIAIAPDSVPGLVAAYARMSGTHGFLPSGIETLGDAHVLIPSWTVVALLSMPHLRDSKLRFSKLSRLKTAMGFEADPTFAEPDRYKFDPARFNVLSRKNMLLDSASDQSLMWSNNSVSKINARYDEGYTHEALFVDDTGIRLRPD